MRRRGARLAAVAIAVGLGAGTAGAARTAEPERFEEAHARAVLTEVMAAQAPHPIGTAENRRVRERIEQRLSAAGYAVETQRRFLCGNFRRMCGTVENLLARREGTEPGEAVLLNTHYDTQPATPGAGDPMAGVAVALEVARILAAEPPRRRAVIFLFNDGEEAGLLGSQAFVEHHPWAKEVSAVINLDARGSRGEALVAATIGDDGAIVSAWAKSSMPRGSSLVPALVGLLPNANDLAAFEALGVPGALFGFAEGARSYHSAADTIERLSPRSLRGMGEAALGTVRQLAATERIERAGGATVFVALGPWLVRWPTVWTPGLLVAGGLLVVALVLYRRRSGELTWPELAWGFAGFAIAALLGGAGALAVEKARQALIGGGTTLVAHPVPSSAAIVLGAFAGALAGLVAIGRRSGRWGQQLAVLVLLLGAGVYVHFAAPLASYLFVLPLLAVGALGLVARAPGGVLATLFALGLWLAAIAQFHALFGLAAPMPIGILLGLLLGLAAPWLPNDRRRWLPPAAAAAASLVALVVVARRPTFSDDQPQFQSLLYASRVESGRADWIATGWPIPDGWRTHLAFEDDDDAGLPWSRVDRGLAAAAPNLHLPHARFEIESATADAASRRVRGRLRPSGATLLLQIVVADGQRLRSVRLDGVEVPPDRLARYAIHHEGFEVIGLWSPAEAGVEIELLIEGDAPLGLELVERTPGLPVAAQALLAARPSWSQPNGFGDSTVVRTKIEL